MFKLLKWNIGDAETSKEKVPSEFLQSSFTSHRESYPEILEFSCSEKFKKILRKTSIVVYFKLILAKKKLHDGRLLLRLSGKAVMMVFCSTEAVTQNC